MAIIIFILILALLILVHEIGHFITAKRSGIRIFEFGIGFPPQLISTIKKGTKYSLNLIPLGGFVRMKEYKEDDLNLNDSFQEKSFLRRMLVVLAGTLMNAVLGVVLIITGYTIGLPKAYQGDIANAHISDKHVYITTVLPNSPAEKSGIQSGDEIFLVNNQPVENVDSFINDIKKNPKKEFHLVILRDDIKHIITLQPAVISQTGEIGLGIGLVQAGLVRYPLHWAVINGLKDSLMILGEITKAIFSMLGRIITGQPIGADVTGPIGIAVLTGKIFNMGFLYLIQFTAILSLNLAIINLFPFPALDGGRALFLILEKIRRKPLNTRLEIFIQNIGFLVLIFLVLIVTIKDLARLNLFSGLF